VVRFASFLAALAAATTACWLLGCAASLGPGYVVETQEIHVSFEAEPQPVIHVAAEYRLTNTGNQPLDSLNVRLPGRRFRPQAIVASWDGNTPAGSLPPENPRDTRFRLPQPWKIGETHTLKFSYAIPSAYESSPDAAGSEALAFSSDAFYLPAEGWNPELPPARGVFGFGGIPPKKWNLMVEVPAGFLVHASGEAANRPGKGENMRFRFVQTQRDFNPFVIAGRYRETREDLPPDQKIRIWSRSQPDAGTLRQAAESVAKTVKAYDALFGPRGPSHLPIWIVECPSSVGCISLRAGGYSLLLEGTVSNRYAELASRDTLLVDPRASPGGLETAVGPALAAGWLGYGQNPGFYEPQPPMSALPAFAAALVRETTSGPEVRGEIIARALAVIPANARAGSADTPAVTRAKSLLLFYALAERVGPDALQKALQHMLYARQSRDFEVADLISAVEEQSHQTVGPFVRQWLKRPGIPEEFRARHQDGRARQESSLEEALE
jgi:hypothetical protein